jgi:hypothetical protein
MLGTLSPSTECAEHLYSLRLTLTREGVQGPAATK